MDEVIFFFSLKTFKQMMFFQRMLDLKGFIKNQSTAAFQEMIFHVDVHAFVL